MSGHLRNWLKKVSRPFTFQSNSKRPTYRPLLEELEDRRLFATNITQYHVDTESTGANLTETQLTSSNVNAADFGQLYNTALDGQVYAEPLVVTNVTIAAGANTVGAPGTYDSVVFVATENDSLYALNATNGAILWHRTFLDTTNSNDHIAGATSVTTIPSSVTGSSDINPQIGITGTPVIDLSNNTIYVVPNTQETVGGQAYYVQRLHAINLANGTDSAASYTIGTTTNGNTNNTQVYVAGTGDGNNGGVVQFNALHEGLRSAMGLVNGNVYVEWSSHGDNGPYHGWVVSWNVSNLATNGMTLSGVLCTDPNGGDGGIWQGGGGLTWDPDEANTFYFETGNGDPRGGNPPLNAQGFPSDNDYYESVIKVVINSSTQASPNSNGWGMSISDYFTPSNVNALDNADEDFGSGAPLVLPDSAGIPGYPHLLVAAGKDGRIFLIDRDNMGKFNAAGDNVLNSVYNSGTGAYTAPTLINGSLSTPAYYHGVLYWVSGYSSDAEAFVISPITNPAEPYDVASIDPVSETANGSFGYVPGSVEVSANGDEDPQDAVVWMIDRNSSELHAYSALSLSTELWNSGANSIATVKFATPDIANGEVFVGTQTGLQVYGLTGASTPVSAPNAVSNLSASALSGSSIELDWSDSTVSPNFATNYAIQESTASGGPYTTVANAGQESTTYTVTGLNSSTTYYFRIVSSNSAGASNPSSPSASATTTSQTGQTPTAPVGLGAVPASGSEVYLNWTNTASNETGFTLTRATDSLFTQNVVVENIAAAPFYYTDNAAGLSPGNTYYYKIQASNSSGLSSSSNTASVAVPNVPPAPTNASAILSGSSITVSWTDNAGPFALGYQVSRSVNGGPYSLLVDLPETSDEPPTTYTYVDSNNIAFGNSYSYEIEAENVSGFSTPAYASASNLGTATLSLDNAGNLVYTAAPGAPDLLNVNLAGGIYTLTDTAVTITVTGAGAGFVTGSGTSSVTIPAADVGNMTLTTSNIPNSITILNDAVPITISANSGGGDPDINLGDPTNNTTISGTITNLSNGTMSISGTGTTNITGNINADGSGGVAITGSGPVNISGAVNIGYGSLTDTGSGQAIVSGNVSGYSDTSPGLLEGQLNDDIDLTDQPNPTYGTDVVLSPVMGETYEDNPVAAIQPTSDHQWASPDEWVYQGQIYVAPSAANPSLGFISFWAYVDDNSSLKIDGSQVWSSTNFDGGNHAALALTPGWHNFDFRVASSSAQAGGLIPDEEAPGEGLLYRVDSGPSDPLALSTNIADYVVPTDNGTGNLFRTPGDPGGVTMDGTGTLTLSGSNLYYGPTSVQSGTLVVGNNGALSPNSSSTTVSTGGILALPASGGIQLPSDPVITLTSGGAIDSLGGTNSIAVPINVSGSGVIGSNAGTLTVSGNVTCEGIGGLTLTGAGAIDVTGNINLGPLGNLTDSAAGNDTISGLISGTAASATANEQGLNSAYYQIQGTQQGYIQPAAASNPNWIGNQIPTATAFLTGALDFPDISANGFQDNLGTTYYNFGNNNNQVLGRWYGDISIPGTGNTPVPINFATASDDGSMLYIDGNAVVSNNNYQGVTRATGLVSLTPGVHSIDVEYYNGGGGAAMDAQWDPTGGTNFVDIPSSVFSTTQPVNGLIKNGNGTLTLTNTNAYIGTTTINAGTLIAGANGAMGPATAAGVVVNTGGDLALAGGVNYTTPEPVAISGTGPAKPISNAYVGFTGATGGLNSMQNVLNWTYASGATNINYGSGFATNNLSLNGGASVQGTALQLTDGNNGEARTAWTSTPVPVGTFTTTFQWTYGNTVAPQADGFTFAVQGSGNTAVGTGGGSLAYNGISGNSYAVEFNNYTGSGSGSGSDFGVGVNGTVNHPIDLTAYGINFHNNPNDVYQATVTADGVGDVTVSIWDTTTNTTTTPNYTGTFSIIGSYVAGASGAIQNVSGANSFAGNITLQGNATISASAGSLTLTGNVNLGATNNLTATGAGQVTISGLISGTASAGTIVTPGLIGQYFQGTNGGTQGTYVQPAAASNSVWLGNQTPAATVQLTGAIDFPNISANGFDDNNGHTYYNFGNNNNDTEARWYGDITIPGSGNTPVPINFATTSDDGSVLYVDGNLVVNNNFYQGATQRTGLVDLTPGLHTIDIEWYNGGGGASMLAQWDPTGGTNFVDIPNSVFSTVQSANGVIKTGSGTLTLSHTNSYVGATTIAAGTLIATANGAMGPATASGVTVRLGAALGFAGNVNYTSLEPITIIGSGPAGNGAIENIGGANSYAASFSLTGATTIGADVGSSLTLSGNISMGSTGNLTVTGSGNTTITGIVSGTATSGFTTTQGLIGQYFQIGTTSSGQNNMIQPAVSSNSLWLGNQTPTATAQLTGAIDFPNISSNGFDDNTGHTYYNFGNNNNNVEARWYGDIIIPGTGTTAVPIDFATSSDDGSMIYIDGNAVVSNNFYQGTTQRTALASLTPGLHTIDIEYYNGNGGAAMDVQWDPTGGTNFVDIPNSAFVVPAVNNLIKMGAGTLVLTNTNTYHGPTLDNLGTIQVDGSIANSSGVTVASGATLSGHGTVPATTVNGTLQPGDPGVAGTLHTDLAFAAGSTLKINENTVSGNVVVSEVSVTGTASLTGSSLVLSFADTVPLGTTYTILHTTGGLGGTTFNSLPNGSTLTDSSGQLFQVHYTSTDVTITKLHAPLFTSAASTSFDVGTFGSFNVTTSGYPAVTLSELGTDTRPSGVTFVITGGSGVLSGTPAAGTAGTYTLHFTASNGLSPNGTQTFILTVNPALSIAPPTLPNGASGSAYNQAINVTGGTAPYTTFTVTGFNGGTTGLTSSAVIANAGAGTFTVVGTPTAAGTATFTVNVTDTAGATLTQNYTLTVVNSNPPPGITAVVINQDLAALYNAAGQPNPGMQRSMVNDVVYTFSEPVNITSFGVDPNVFTIAVASGWTGTVPTLSWAAVSGSGNTEWAVSFSGAGVTGNSIANGAYTITVNHPAAITAASDIQALNLTSGINGAAQSFYRLFGDINGDEVVNNADNVRFKQALTTYNAAFDFNADEAVNNADNVRFKLSLSIAFTGFTPTI